MSTNENEVRVGTIATVKIGRNEVEVEVVEVLGNAVKVKSAKTGREFTTSKFERIVREPEAAEPEAVVDDAAASEDTPNPAPAAESGTAKEKKPSLINAAFEVLAASGEPLNTKEMVKRAIESGLWTPTNCKTPEQTLYGSIFREIKEKEFPRFSKSATRKGAFVAVK